MKKTENIKPIIKFNNGSGAVLCNKCNKIIKNNLTKEEFDGGTKLLYCNNCIEIIVNTFPIKSEFGFTTKEQEKLLKLFPNINKEKYDNALMGITCMMIDNQIIVYHCDIITALKCGTQNRNIKHYEWD